MAIYENSSIFSGVVDIFKYPRHQLIINEASNFLEARKRMVETIKLVFKG